MEARHKSAEISERTSVTRLEYRANSVHNITRNAETGIWSCGVGKHEIVSDQAMASGLKIKSRISRPSVP